jgi:hypothetical protein
MHTAAASMRTVCLAGYWVHATSLNTLEMLTDGTGSTALVSLGGYTYYSGMKGLRERQHIIEMSKSKYKYGSRQLGILMLSGSLIGMGLYRTFN